MKKVLLLMGCGLLISWQLLAQQRTVSGTVVTAADQSALPGVNVVIKGTTTGTTTDIDGNYRLEVPQEGATLVYSYVGFEPKEVNVGARSVIDISLQPDVQQLGEVVVTGYGGKVDKRQLTGSVSTIQSEAIENLPMPSVDMALQGNSPGVLLTSSSGQPGAATQIRIRGVGSINASSEPLWVIDGIPVVNNNPSQLNSAQANPLANLNPNDIESITVLKDASAAAIYGSRAANGVVLITTKSGEEGKTKINFKAQYGITLPTNTDFRVTNADEYIELYRETVFNSGLNPDDPNGEYYLPLDSNYRETDWYDLSIRNGQTSNYELSASGGSGGSTYFVSANYFSQEGIVIGSGLDRFSTLLKMDQQASDKLSFGVKINPSYVEQDNVFDGGSFASPVSAAMGISPLTPVYDPETGDFNLDIPENGGENPIAFVQDGTTAATTARVLGNIYARYQFLPSLSFRATGAIDYLNQFDYEYWPQSSALGSSFGGLAQENDSKDYLWTGQGVFTYAEAFGKHNVDGLLGVEAQKFYNRQLYAGGTVFPSDDFRTIASAAEPAGVFGSIDEWSIISAFFNGSYNFDERYFLNVGVRRDGHSRFGADNRFANFWSAGASWNAAEEEFLSNVSWINEARLRASYGTTGNASIGNYASIGTYTPSGAAYVGNSGSAPARIANPDLRWEKSTLYNVALDFRVFRRFGITVDYYNRVSSDLLLNVPVSSTTGFLTLLQNAGSMRNRGLELALNTVNIDAADFRWATNFNITFNRNRILDLAGAGPEFIAGTKIRREGEPFQSYYLFPWEGVNPANGAPLWSDTLGNIVDDRGLSQRQISGNADPDFYGGLTNTFSYRGFSVSAFFYFLYGNEALNQTRPFMEHDGTQFGSNYSNNQLRRWQNPGDITDVPRPSLNNPSTINSALSTRFLDDGSFLRLRNVTVGYNFPAALLSNVGLTKLRLYAQGQNIWTLTRFNGFDPEVAVNGNEFFEYPNGAVFTGGIEIGF